MTTKTYTLPSYWASYLINGDSSSLNAADLGDIKYFLASNNLPMPVSCGEESFAWSNDANNLDGEVREFTFLS